MFWLTVKIGDKSFIAKFDRKCTAYDFYDLICTFAVQTKCRCNIKLYKNVEVIEKCKLL